VQIVLVRGVLLQQLPPVTALGALQSRCRARRSRTDYDRILRGSYLPATRAERPNRYRAELLEQNSEPEADLHAEFFLERAGYGAPAQPIFISAAAPGSTLLEQILASIRRSRHAVTRQCAAAFRPQATTRT